MERYTLNDQAIPAPQGVDGLTRLKSRSRRYYSVLYKNVGYANGVGGVTFTDPDSCRLLIDAYQRHNVDASVEFRVVIDEIEQYRAWVDFSTIGWTHNTVSCSFRDDPNLTTLETNATTPQRVEMAQYLNLPTKRLAGPSTHLFTAGRVVQQASPTAQAVNVWPVLTLAERSDNNALPGLLLSVVDPLQPSAFYRNTTAEVQLLRLSGLLTGNVSSAQAVMLSLSLLLIDGNQTTTIPQGQLQAEPATKAVTLLLAADLAVPPGAALYLTLTGGATTRWSLQYSANSLLSLDTQIPYPATNCAAIRAFDLLDSLVGTFGYRLESTFFQTTARNFYLTNGYSLRGLNVPITTSLQDVFDGLNALWNLALWIEGDRVRIETKATYLQRFTKTLKLHRPILSVLYKPCPAWLVNTVTAGYSVWRGSNPLSADEYNSPRTYQTQLRSVRAPLDLSCKTLIASGSLIEEQRRKQFTDSTKAASQTDDSLFIIDATSNRLPVTRQNVATIFNVIDQDTPYNLSITPARNLQRWLDVFPLYRLTLISAEGNAQLVSRFLGEKMAVDESGGVVLHEQPFFDGRQCELVIPMSQAEFNTLPDYLVVTEGQRTVGGLIMDASWHETDEQGTIARLLLYS